MDVEEYKLKIKVRIKLSVALHVEITPAISH